MQTRNSVVLAKVEATYGADPTPTPAVNALLVYDLDIKPTGDVVERNFLKASLSQLPFIRGLKYVEVSFKTELKGSGSRGQLPTTGWEGALIQACGFSEIVTAATSIVWAPVSTNFKSVALYVYQGGNTFHKVLGCRGSVKFKAEVGKYIEAEWKFKGIYAAPTDAVPGAQTFSGVVPVPVLSAGLTLGAYSPVATAVEIDMNVSTGLRKSMNSPAGIVGVEITGRQPQGSFDPEAVTEATAPFWNQWELATQLALNIGPIGSTSGNIIQIAAPKVQYKEIGYGDREGILTYQVPFGLAMNAGDDEVAITIT